MAKALKGRILGLKFKTFSGAAKRAAADRFYQPAYRFEVIDADAHDRAQGFAFRIRKTKRQAVSA